MKKVMLLVVALGFVGAAQADVLFDGVNPGDNWIAWANCFNADGTSAGWGSQWGLPDVPATFDAAGLKIGPNTNTYNPGDAYWVNPDGSGNKIMEMNVYFETWGLAGQSVTFNYDVLSNDLPDGFEHLGFIKVLDPDAGWATVQSTFADLALGAGSVNLTVDALTNPVVQVGFLVKGIVTDPASAEAATAVVIETIPEPATMALLALGGLLIKRRRM